MANGNYNINYTFVHNNFAMIMMIKYIPPPATKTVNDVARKVGLSVKVLDERITEAAAKQLAKHCNPWEGIGLAILRSYRDVDDIKDRYHDNEQRRERILICAYEQGITIRKLVSALLEKKRIVAAEDVCKEIRGLPVLLQNNYAYTYIYSGASL